MLSLGLALGFAPAFSQAAPSTSGVASVSLDHNFLITTNGFGVWNDSFTFNNNNGSAAVQIPTLKVGIPNSIAQRTVGMQISPTSGYSYSQSTVGNMTYYSIAPSQPTLNAGANSKVTLKGYMSNSIFNFTSAGFNGSAPALVLLSPSLNVNVTAMNSTLTLPTGATFGKTPAGFTAPAPGGVTSAYTENSTAILPQASAQYLNFTESNESDFAPISVTSLSRTIVPASNGAPLVQDEFTIHNLASYDVAEVHVVFLGGTQGAVTVIPNTEPPLVNPQSISVSGGMIIFYSTAFGSALTPGSNLTMSVSYPLPASAMTVSGSSVKVTVPYTPFIEAVIPDYEIGVAPAKGVTLSGTTSVDNKTLTPFTTGSVSFSYSVSVGWAADQAIPAGALLFAVAFAMFAIQRPAAKEKSEEIEKESYETADVLRAFEDKTGLETQYIEDLARASKGSKGKSALDQMRNEVADLRGRALQRLSELKKDLGSGKQFDLLTRVGEAEKEEDRAFRDLLNLFAQFQTGRMNDETYKRLLPSYRKRVEAAINRLSDMLHEVQEEER